MDFGKKGVILQHTEPFIIYVHAVGEEGKSQKEGKLMNVLSVSGKQTRAYRIN